MCVQRVVMPDSGRESWTLLGEDLSRVEPVERFLAFLASVEKSPNTIKAYVQDLKDWWVYLAGMRLAAVRDFGGCRGRPAMAEFLAKPGKPIPGRSELPR